MTHFILEMRRVDCQAAPYLALVAAQGAARPQTTFTGMSRHVLSLFAVAGYCVVERIRTVLDNHCCQGENPFNHFTRS